MLCVAAGVARPVGQPLAQGQFRRRRGIVKIGCGQLLIEGMFWGRQVCSLSMIRRFNSLRGLAACLLAEPLSGTA